MRHAGVTERLDLLPQNTTPFDAYLEDPDCELAPVTVAMGAKQSFDFVPSFTSQRFPVELLNEGFQRQLQRWQEAYDVIVLDSAPVVPFADALSIAPLATGVVVCASEARSTRPQLDEALDLLDDPQITVLGVALTDVPRRQREPSVGRRAAGQGPAESYSTKVPSDRRAAKPGRRG